MNELCSFLSNRLSPVHTFAEKCDSRRKRRKIATATVAEFGDSRTFLRQCGQAFTRTLLLWTFYSAKPLQYSYSNIVLWQVSDVGV